MRRAAWDAKYKGGLVFQMIYKKNTIITRISVRETCVSLLEPCTSFTDPPYIFRIPEGGGATGVDVRHERVAQAQRRAHGLEVVCVVPDVAVARGLLGC